MRILLFLIPFLFLSCAKPVKGSKVLGEVYIQKEENAKPSVSNFREREREKIRDFVNNYFNGVNNDIEENSENEAIDKLLNSLSY